MELKADRFDRQLASEPLRPVYLIDPRTEDEIHAFLARTRQVLV